MLEISEKHWDNYDTNYRPNKFLKGIRKNNPMFFKKWKDTFFCCAETL